MTHTYVAAGYRARTALVMAVLCAITIQTFGDPVNLHIATNPSHGIDVDETNTGVPRGHTLTNVTSTITVTEAWIAGSNGGSRIIENRNFLSGAGLLVQTSDVTVRYCKFNGIGGITLADGVSGIIVQDTELDGNNENLTDNVAVSGSGLTMLRVHVHRWPRAMWVGQGDIYVEGCYFHDLTSDGSGSHIENIYVAGGANQTYVRNKFISNGIQVKPGNVAISASLAIYNEDWAPFPALDNIVVSDNYFESDGGYALYCGAISSKGNPFAINMVVSGNIFGRGEQRHCGVFGPVVAFNTGGQGNVWSDNVWGDRGPFWQEGDPEKGDTVPDPGPI